MKNHLQKTVSITFCIALLSASYTSCVKDDDIPEAPLVQMVEMTPYKIKYPPFFPPIKVPDGNEMFEERVLLGKQLFFDTRLSNNGESCNTCHLPEYGFSNKGTSAFDDGLTSLPLINLAWSRKFMWAGRITGTLEDVMISELENRFNTDVSKINNDASYKEQFGKYYGVSEVTKEVIAKALAQYIRALVSSDTKFDQWRRGEVVFTDDESFGMQLFQSEDGDCDHCHALHVFTIDELKNNGLDTFYNKNIDNGNYNVTGDPADRGRFKVPNLRNVALRTHYMHDGRFTSLEEVIDFYDLGVHFVDNVDPVMTKINRANGGLGLTSKQKQQLIAFLKTLTDTTMINNRLFQAPK